MSNIKAMRDAFLENVWKAMHNDREIFFLTADFGSPVLDKIRSQFPDRFVNVGIAEQNLINVSAGLALEGYKVFAYAIAPFITMRCYEQIRVNLALLSTVRKMNVNLIGVGAGYSYVVSGPTHQCYEDLTIMRAMPNFQILSPADHVTAGEMFNLCLDSIGPKYLRLDAQQLTPIYNNKAPNLKSGFEILKIGLDGYIVATGYMVHTALKVSEMLEEKSLSIGVIDMFNLTNYDEENLSKVFKECGYIFSLEEGFSGCGGLDALLFNFLSKNQLKANFHNIGVEGRYSFELGTREILHEKTGVGPKIVFSQILAFLSSANI
jgi:transketolase